MFAIPMISVIFLPALSKNLPDEHAKGAKIDGWGFTLIGAFAGAITMFFTDMNMLWTVATVVTLVAFIVYINKAEDPIITPAFFKKSSICGNYGGYLRRLLLQLYTERRCKCHWT